MIFKRLFAKITKAHASRTTSAVDNNNTSLNMRAAIEAHMQWRRRLNDVVFGSNKEIIDTSHVCKDNQCVLGKWIYGDGMEKFARLREFKRLQNTHAQFHVCAARVLDLHYQGYKTQAIELLNSEFHELSNNLQLELAELFYAG